MNSSATGPKVSAASMDKATRAKLLDEAPIRPPVLTTKVWGITALSTIIGVIPATVMVFFVWSRVSTWIWSSFGVQVKTPVYVLALIAITLCGEIPLLAAGRSASLYVLRLVKYYLDHGEPEKAEQVAEILSIKIWRWHAQRRLWFREFVVARGLNERVPRFAKYTV